MNTNVENYIAKSRRRFIIWMLVLVGIGGSIYGMVKLVSKNSTAVDVSITVDQSNANDWVEGSREAKVTLIEYSDFECPFCAKFSNEVSRLHDEFGDKLLIVYRNFPLRQHKNARLAAQAAEAAGRQGKFWEMHDWLFDYQATWAPLGDPRDAFAGYARALNLNADQFASDLDSRTVRAAVEADYQSGVKAGITSTPTFFLNGEQMLNLKNYDDFRSRVTDTINKNP